MEYLWLHICCKLCNNLYFADCSVSLYIDCNKRGQTSRPVVGAEVQQVVTLKRTYVIVITFWIVPTAFSVTLFWNTLTALWYGNIVIVLCLVTSILSYTKIFFSLRQHQNQLQDHVQQPNQANQLNIARHNQRLPEPAHG